MLFDLEVDEDIAKLNLYQLQQLVMRNRRDARKGIETLMASGNNHCWDDMVQAILNQVTKEERENFRMGYFAMTPERTLFFCKRFINLKHETCSRIPLEEKTPLD